METAHTLTKKLSKSFTVVIQPLSTRLIKPNFCFILGLLSKVGRFPTLTDFRYVWVTILPYFKISSFVRQQFVKISTHLQIIRRVLNTVRLPYKCYVSRFCRR